MVHSTPVSIFEKVEFTYTYLCSILNDDFSMDSTCMRKKFIFMHIFPHKWSSKNYDSVPHSQGLLNEVSEYFCRTMLHISNSRTDNSGKCYQSLKALWQNSKLKHCVSHVHVHWESMRHDCRFYPKFMTIMIKSMVIDFFCIFFFLQLYIS